MAVAQRGACTAEELIRMAETDKDLDGRKLTRDACYALHNAWLAMFGEGLGMRSDAAEGPTEPPTDQHPLLSVPDDKMLRSRDVIRLCGIPRSTLKRWRREGRFPKAQRLSPQALHVGWPARQVKAWLRNAS